MSEDLKSVIEAAWAARDTINTATTGQVRDAVFETLEQLDAGRLRVAERGADGTWTTHQWAKQAILLSFRLSPNRVMEADVPGPFWDKVPGKFAGWDAARFEAAGFRAVPGAVVRKGAFVNKGVVLMPSFVNIGAYVDEGTMVDTWATVGSCAQIGKNVHISGGAGIGGVLEPLQANPTIIEDNCFIGARAEVAEGVIVREGSVLSMGTFITATTPIIDRRTGETFTGEVPPYSVVVSGNRPNPVDPGLPSTYCAVIMKRVDERTRSKTSINELLRD
ncbi:2,3,4,5-tetrahydropyridine-2,6-dicarboxylate N-succinyltransferase [Phenylobacterium sp. SCN 70-31]|uniref:2,3,4,5-tetrahydropyridine-2,6-dicarboxylate N-succinyltransferase n=1 Tax=Phenylobacterium sp. SCN 70-31 TaxID=1660129 RepID=UPI00086C4F7C|nr:2,3,4,5-tetrahydropyridine-2,6-dicarboxylate N-succinyltransferase [Phenylobacterium sp. SCN 70-31]ODT87736.1 MAG: 2,3,4,5-tetrahydropyridine-2,6-dicarboxylate N-succinyltransferase [Phenylobacterium sp. SCN 70-31]